MNITLQKDVAQEELQSLLWKASLKNQQKKKMQKKTALQAFIKKVSFGNKNPVQLQRELRNEWH